MQIEITFVGLKEAVAKFGALTTAIQTELPRLFVAMGNALVDDVKLRIITRNKGGWAPASKWTRAKTGYAFPTLLGAEKYVKLSVTQRNVKVVGKSSGWTLTQHHEGFENQLYNKGEIVDDHGRVTLKIKDAAPLNLYQEFRKGRSGQVKPVATVFLFAPQKPGVTPARKIWPSEAEVEAVAQPVASRWLENVLRETGVR